MIMTQDNNTMRTAIQVRRWALLLALLGAVVLTYLQMSGWFDIETDDVGFPRGGMTIFFMFGVLLSLQKKLMPLF